MKPTLTVACFFLKSAWQAVSLRSVLTALLLAPLAELQASHFKTPRADIAPFSTSTQSQPKLNP